jgi:hypothetical protein
MRLEVGEDSYPGIPARVVQYEGDLCSLSFWSISCYSF